MVDENLKFNVNKMEGNFIFSLFEKAQDDSLSPDQLKYIKDHICEEKFHLKKVNFENYKKFSKFNFRLNENLNVIIGSNGEGKTTILLGIVKHLSWIVNSTLNDRNSAKNILDDDISNNFSNNQESNVCSIECQFNFGSSLKFDGELVKVIDGYHTKRKSKLYEYRTLGKIFSELNKKFDFNLPLLVYYSVNRFSEKGNRKRVNKNLSKLDIFKNGLDGVVKFDNFIEILTKYLKIQTSDEIYDGYRTRLDELLKIKEFIVDAHYKKMLLEQEEGLKEILNESRENHMYKNDEILNRFNSLVRNVYPNFLNFELDQSTGDDEIFLNFKDQPKINIQQLSDGERTFIGLIMDIAIRLIVLNPQLNDPFKGVGIVVIDEIELHLHPKWQQKILIVLQQSFPNIQFITTTHSPHVLSTVDKRCIMILSDEKMIEPDYQTKGVMSSDVLELIMGTQSIPDVQEAKDLREINQLIECDQYDSNKFKELERKVKRHFGENHPEYIKLESSLKFKELKKKLKEKIGTINK